MGHRKWSFGSATAAEVSLKELEHEHGKLYDAWEVERDRAKDAVEEKRFAEGQCARLSWLTEQAEKDLDEARKRITELESMLASEVADNVKLRGREVGDEVGNLLQELADANNRIAELEAPPVINKVTGLPTGEYAPIRVPFSDAQIERMAVGLRQSYYEHYGITADGVLPDYYKELVRAALAAGGLEPCAVPDYAPDDVALMPVGDGEVESLARAIWKSYENLYCRSGVHMVSFEENRAAWFTQARAAITHLRPTQGHVLRDRLVDARRKVENQRVELKRLHALVTDLRDQLAAADLDLADKAFYIREFASVSAERDALRECDSVPDVDPPADQVEALARVLQCAYSDECGSKKHFEDWPAGVRDGFRAEARAAIAHLAKRPEGLPTAEELAKIGADAWNACAGERHLGVRDRARATAIRDAVLAALEGRPFKNALEGE